MQKIGEALRGNRDHGHFSMDENSLDNKFRTTLRFRIVTGDDDDDDDVLAQNINPTGTNI